MQAHPPLAGTGRPQIPALTGLRFFFALWVVMFHQNAADGTIMGARIPFYMPALVCLIRTGYLAVGVFFTLSGFVLAYNYSLQAPWPFRRVINFAVARFAHIYQAYAVGLILMAPIVLLNAAGLPEKEWFKTVCGSRPELDASASIDSLAFTHAASWNCHVGFALGRPVGGFFIFACFASVRQRSYTMYILHWPVFEWMNWLSLRSYGIPRSGFTKFSLYLGILIALSILVHRFIEEPANGLIKRTSYKILSRRFEPSTINAAA